jgi:hypothetical protein
MIHQLQAVACLTLAVYACGFGWALKPVVTQEGLTGRPTAPNMQRVNFNTNLNVVNHQTGTLKM